MGEKSKMNVRKQSSRDSFKTRRGTVKFTSLQPLWSLRKQSSRDSFILSASSNEIIIGNPCVAKIVTFLENFNVDISTLLEQYHNRSGSKKGLLQNIYAGVAQALQ